MMISSNLYNEISKFIDKSTLIEYIGSAQKNNQKILKNLKLCFNEKFQPFEKNFYYQNFTMPIESSFFESKPLILLIGQYSSGKSTFVKYLIEKNYPGIRIGPEPTTDKFVAVMYGQENAIIPGNALVFDQSKQFRPLVKFGNHFLKRFQAAQVDSNILKGLTIIDTPGILSDNNNSNEYDYKGVIDWFAHQADRVFLFIDAHKLELSGDFNSIMEIIHNYYDKLRIVLNKTDLVSEQEMIRIYGSLMWFLGQSLEMNEVLQIFVVSFCGRKMPFRWKLYECEEYRIYEDLSNLPKESLLRKIDFISQRVQQISMQACIISLFNDSIKKYSWLRYIFEKQIKRLHLNRLQKFRDKIVKQYQYSKQDGPDIKMMEKILLNLDLHRIFSENLVHNKEEFVNEDLPKLIDQINNENFGQIPVYINEFQFGRGEGFDERALDNEWIVSKYKDNYEKIFDDLKDKTNKVSASKAKAQMLKSNLQTKVLNKIWTMVDIDNDGMLDQDEFYLAMYVISLVLQNYNLPPTLPKHLIPPLKRK